MKKIISILAVLVAALLFSCAEKNRHNSVPLHKPEIKCTLKAHDICRSAYEARYDFWAEDRQACMEYWVTSICSGAEYDTFDCPACNEDVPNSEY
jgi:hypothetical protein